jgi:hypothetical protein
MGKSLTIRLDDATAAALDAAVRRTRRSRGELVREAVLAHVRVTQPTALDSLAEYVGAVSGPADLSTNKAHLRDFGRPRRRG